MILRSDREMENSKLNIFIISDIEYTIVEVLVGIPDDASTKDDFMIATVDDSATARSQRY